MDHSTIFAEGDLTKLVEAAETVLNKLPHRIILAPSPGMVMVKQIDPLEKTPFYLGEVFVTQCEVEVDGLLGYGCVLGRENERAKAGAVLDAVIGNGHPLASEVTALLEPIGKSIEQKWAEERKRTALSKVNFDVKKG